jgi:hypothetical protein
MESILIIISVLILIVYLLFLIHFFLFFSKTICRNIIVKYYALRMFVCIMYILHAVIRLKIPLNVILVCVYLCVCLFVE